MPMQWKQFWNRFSNWKYQEITVLGLVALVYFSTHLFSLQSLPIFADEAIYIRWAQLIQHEPNRYLFFSMNDGKPPLFIWILSLTFSLIPQTINALWISRTISVVIGFGQLLITDRIVKTLRGTPLTRLIAAFILIVAPMWTFHHRIALMDGLLTFFLSMSFWGLLRLHQINLEKPSFTIDIEKIVALLSAALGFGLALWTKTPALFFGPVFILFAYAAPFMLDTIKIKAITPKWLLLRTFWFGFAGFLGLCIFLSLKISPVFGSLFGRSTDFTYTINEVFASQGLIFWNNLNRVLPWLSTYLRPELLGLSAIALAVSKYRRMHWLFWLTAFGFAAPLLILGKTLHPRYFLPMAPFFTISAAFMIHEAEHIIREKMSWEMFLVGCILVLFFITGSLRFLFFSYFDPNQIPFTLHDREQYLTEWSSGHGLRQVVQAAQKRINEGEYITIITEGSFGSLPDGLLVYFDRLPEIRSIRIEGLAQYPVKTIPEWAWDHARDHRTWLVVNSHRLSVDAQTQQQLYLEAEYTRPYGAPSLQVYELRPETPVE